MSGSNGNRSSNNDGYLSESGYSRRHQANYKNEVTSSGNKSSFHRINQNNNNKHGLIPEDRSDSFSLSHILLHFRIFGPLLLQICQASS